MILGIAEALGLTGFGDNAFGEGLPLRHPDDYNLRCVANLAFGEKSDGSDGVPSADAREMDIFFQARRHLPAGVFDEQRWRGIVGEAVWRQAVYLLNRGGRFEDWPGGWKDDKISHPYGKLLNLYQEKTSGTIHFGTGEHHEGVAAYLPIRDYLGAELDDRRLADGLQLITHRIISQTKSRTVADPWLSALHPENG